MKRMYLIEVGRQARRLHKVSDDCRSTSEEQACCVCAHVTGKHDSPRPQRLRAELKHLDNVQLCSSLVGEVVRLARQDYLVTILQYQAIMQTWAVIAAI